MSATDRTGSIWIAVATAIGAAAVVGLVNGVLIGGLKLNALIVTLAVGLIVVGVVNRYGSTFPVQSPVPTGLSDWVSSRILGVSPIFWIGVGLTVVLIVGLRYTAVGRRFQVVGANPVASHVVGVRVSLNQILVYVVAAVLLRDRGVALAGLLRTPGVAVGTPYLLGPIAAVVIGGASLTGGLASPMSTFAAAIFLTGLSQMLRTMGLPTSLQFVVFGLVIIGGMLVSGDRIIRGVEQLLRERQTPKPRVTGRDHVQRGSMRRERRNQRVLSINDPSRVDPSMARPSTKGRSEHATEQDRRHRRCARRWSAAACSSGDDERAGR